MINSTNPQLELAFEYVQKTNKNIFLTGKAGTGKTTFLHRIKEISMKRLVVVAPTGVAAINAKGVTIHSFFQLPFGPFIPDNKKALDEQRRFRKDKIAIIRGLDLLIIDEISMVRSDVLDGIDAVLRKYKNKFLPFGGVQLLMIGDLHQLPPVVKNEEWSMLRPYYDTSYFFGSRALTETDLITMQLTHIYRQSDQAFIDLLNKVRDNKMDEEVLKTLNSRFIDNFQPPEDAGYITLTSHNNTARNINQEKLQLLKGKSKKFKAELSGNFPTHAYPTHEELEVKIGAQVLFVKNDKPPLKRFFNGKIGKITKIAKDIIFVKCPEDSDVIEVVPMTWENIAYTMDAQTKEVEETIKGSFTQYPLKLAWAITIHKSQGLTFERAVIDAQSAFAHGQVYVALSRCKTFEGIVLRSKIENRSVKTDRVVSNYSDIAEQNPPTQNHLEQAQLDYQKYLVKDLFDFQSIRRAAYRLNKTYTEHQNTLTTIAQQIVNEWLEKAEALLFSVSSNFQFQLNGLLDSIVLPEKNPLLQDRIQKASEYFLTKIEKEFIPQLSSIPLQTDNQSVEKQAEENLLVLTRELVSKKYCLIASKDKFNVQAYLKAKGNAAIDMDKIKKQMVGGGSLNTKHPELYAQLNEWRKTEASSNNISTYQVLSLTSIMELTKKLPTSSAGLLKTKGIGQKKIDKYGAALLKMIEAYCTDNNIKGNLLTVAKLKPNRSNTKMVTLQMFENGSTVKQIMEDRQLTYSTILGHLTFYVKMGKINIEEVMDISAIEEIRKYLVKNKESSTSETKAHFDDKYSYDEIRMVMATL